MLTVHRLATRRGKAYLRDSLGYVGLAATMVPVGFIAQKKGWGTSRSFVLALSAVPPLLATVLAARAEAGPSDSTAGKQRYDLRVEDIHGGSLSFGRAALRNVLKIGLPWQLGHTVAVGAAFGGFEQRDAWTIGATVATYTLLGAMVGSAAFGNGVAIHDRIAGTNVRDTSTLGTSGRTVDQVIQAAVKTIRREPYWSTPNRFESL